MAQNTVSRHFEIFLISKTELSFLSPSWIDFRSGNLISWIDYLGACFYDDYYADAEQSARFQYGPIIWQPLPRAPAFSTIERVSWVSAIWSDRSKKDYRYPSLLLAAAICYRLKFLVISPRWGCVRARRAPHARAYASALLNFTTASPGIEKH